MANIQKRKSGGSLAEVLQANESKILSHLAGKIDLDQFRAATMMCVRKDPKLGNCDPGSFLAAVEFCAGLQLMPGGGRAHVYLVPYGRECTPILGYKGMIALAARCGAQKSVARLVYENDEFELDYGTEDRITHKPARGNRGDVQGAYAVIHMRNGEKVVEYMDLEELDAIKNRAAGNRKGPWSTDEAEMQRKTVFRRAFKWMPIDPGMEHVLEAVTQDEYDDAGVPREPEVEVVKRDAPSDLEGLAEDLEATSEGAEEDDAEEPEWLARAAEGDDEDGAELPDHGLPHVPWDDGDELGGYKLDVRDEAASMLGWIDDSLPSFGGKSWRDLMATAEDDPLRIKLNRIVNAGVTQFKANGVLEPLAARAEIMEAILDGRSSS